MLMRFGLLQPVGLCLQHSHIGMQRCSVVFIFHLSLCLLLSLFEEQPFNLGVKYIMRNGKRHGIGGFVLEVSCHQFYGLLFKRTTWSECRLIERRKWLVDSSNFYIRTHCSVVLCFYY